MRFVVQTAIPVPKKSASSVQMPQASPRAQASMGQSVSSRPRKRSRASLYKDGINIRTNRLDEFSQIAERPRRSRKMVYSANGKRTS
jgi:hypothetical protein